jgi:uncharacterized membrane protein
MKIFFSLFLLPVCVLAAETRPQYEVIDVARTSLGNHYYFGPLRINNSNQIVGAFPAPGSLSEFQGFLWQDGLLQELGTGVVQDINDFGDYIGSVTGAVFQTMAPSLMPRAINNAGQVVGEASQHAFFSDSNGLVLFPIEGSVQQSVALAVNNAGIATGRALFDSGPRRAFIFTTNGSMSIGPVLKLSSSQGVAINDAGHVAIAATQTNGHKKRLYSYLYRDGELTQLRPLPGYPHVNAEAMNNSDEVVGFLGHTVRDFSTNNPPHLLVSISAGFLYSNGKQYNLNRLLTKSSRAWRVTHPLDINDSGWIVARAVREGESGRVVLLRRVSP